MIVGVTDEEEAAADAAHDLIEDSDEDFAEAAQVSISMHVHLLEIEAGCSPTSASFPIA